MQEVNLLNEELKPRNDPLTLKEFGLAWGLLVVVLTGITSWQAYAVWDTENLLKEEKQQLVVANQQLETLTATAKRQADPALLQRLTALLQEREDQRQLEAVL